MTLTHLRRHDPACSQALLSAGKVMICWPIKRSEKNRSFNDPALWWFALDWLNFLCYHLAWHFKWLLLLYRRQISARDRTGRLRVVPHFSSGTVERAKRERAGKSPHARKGDTRRGERKYHFSSFFSLPAACRLFSRGLIFTRARVLLALLSLRKNGGLLVVYRTGFVQFQVAARLSARIHEEINWGHEKANADYERLFMHQGTNKSKQPHIRT